MTSVLDGLRAKMNEINKKYEKEGIDTKKTAVIQAGVPIDRFNQTFSLGSPSLDHMVYHAIPKGCFIEIAGPESAGKTTLAFAIASDHIRQEKQALRVSRENNAKILADFEAKKQAALIAGKKVPTDPVVEDYEPRPILFVDAEGTANPKWAKTCGYDMNDDVVPTIYLTPLGQSAEQIFEDVKELVSTGGIGLVIFDSLVAIAAQQVLAKGKTMEDKMMGGVSGPIGDFVKRCTGLFNRFRTTFIGINGIYMDPSGYGNPEKTPGGTYWKRACSLRLKVKRGKSFNAEGTELKDTENGAIGHIIEVALLKTKFCRWDRRLATVHLDYVRGFDLIQDTIDTAMLYDIIDEVSPSYFVITDPDTGEALSGKIHGAKNIKPFFEENPDLFKRTYNKVYSLLEKQDVPNVKTFEQLLHTDVETLFEINLEKESSDVVNIDEAI